MAQGKNKKVFKARKGAKKRVGDPFAKKEVYEIKAPSVFNVRNVGKTFVNKTQGTKIASDALKGRVFETNLTELQGDDSSSYRKVKLVVDDVQGKSCLTSFYGLDFTRDHLCSLLRKWQTLIEAQLETETKDGTRVRMFAIAFTAKRAKQVKKTCYTSSAQVRQIRKIILNLLKTEAESNEVQGLVKSVIGEDFNKKIVKATAHIFPLQNVYVRKIKVVKRPKLDIVKLMEQHKEVVTAVAGGAKPEEEGAKNLLTSEITPK
jgi:small subunit ribosomal protein S3Ae